MLRIKRKTRSGWLINRLTRFGYNEVHHLYYGQMFVISGCCFGDWIGLFLIFVGVVVQVDDLYQHYVQRHQPRYISPLGRLFLPLYRTKLWRDLVRRFPFLR